MSCSFLLIPTKFPALNSSNKDIISTTIRLGCKCQLVDLVPVISAVYGVILLCDCIFVNEVSKSGSKRSLFGGLTGAALMGTNFRQIIWSLSSDEFVEKHTCFPQTELHTKAIGDSLGFGSSFLFSSVFGKSFLCSERHAYLDVGLMNSIGSYPKIDSFWSSASFIYLCTVGVPLRLFTG
ncbi:hypothetical protein DKX38_017970 [Salix brachista]|uniref:Uncharacterized protein n=1 Tax=Salix brachista TaxID=2182728 RepID=A0A5N5KWQ3_9ROSI|nr:hypothetical protein DKX38_017970 [Salix brachista]